MYISYVSTSRSLYIEYELLPADSFFKMFLFETFVSSKYSVGISQNDLGGQQWCPKSETWGSEQEWGSCLLPARGLLGVL